MGATPHQQEKLENVFDAFNSRLTRVVLKGSAGVGKTYLVNYILEKYNAGRGLIYICAPTHKALGVVRGKINDADNPNYIFSTLHKALKMKQVIEKGRKVFRQRFAPHDRPFRGCKLLVIDESSMLNSEMLGLLEQYDFNILFIGDEKQINPVKEVHSPVFHQNWYTVELTEIIRQGAGNPIIDLSRNLPLIYGGTPMIIEEDNKRSGYLYTHERPKVIYKLAEVNGTDELKYLAWTNNEVDTMNMSVRNHIYGNPALIEKGETLIINSSIFGYDKSEKNYYHTNQEILVEELRVRDMTFLPPGEPATTLKVYDINDDLYTAHEDSYMAFRSMCSNVKANAINKAIKWIEYYGFLDKFLDFKYNHAITVHKSQGSTYKDAIVNVRNINSNRIKEEKTRLMYTAITRASDLLILYNT